MPQRKAQSGSKAAKRPGAKPKSRATMTTAHQKDRKKDKTVKAEPASQKKNKSAVVSMDPFLIVYAHKKALGLLEEDKDKQKAVGTDR